MRYLAELDGPTPDAVLPAGPGPDGLGDEPLRLPWARPGGVADIAGWVDEVLRTGGRTHTGPVRQIKTWNLSMLLRVPTDRGTVVQGGAAVPRP